MLALYESLDRCPLIDNFYTRALIIISTLVQVRSRTMSGTIITHCSLLESHITSNLRFSLVRFAMCSYGTWIASSPLIFLRSVHLSCPSLFHPSRTTVYSLSRHLLEILEPKGQSYDSYGFSSQSANANPLCVLCSPLAFPIFRSSAPFSKSFHIIQRCLIWDTWLSFLTETQSHAFRVESCMRVINGH
ncbi:hypothetical protein BDN70DRAFT_172344 [Pholiota conissans]|uniref:Uncharacterized protein n=1 Tax=Pholiota conissans TaxID=109636 RepID=A0A9P5YWI0_9AGAR|nr:hypothetical protein BDN70DRAFT_172344 [Pholiota conissans]